MMSDFFAKTPFFRLFLFLAGGVLLGEYTNISLGMMFLLFGIGCCALIIPFIIQKAVVNYNLRWLFGFGTLFMLISLGLFLNHRFKAKTNLDYAGQSGIYEVLLDAQPIEKERSIMFRAKLHTFTDSISTHPTKGEVILYFAKDSATAKLQRGDILLVSTTIDQPKRTGNPEEFNYANYLAHQGIGGTGYVSTSKWQKIGEEHPFSLIITAEKCRTYLLNIYHQFGLSGDEFGMLAALTLGYKDALTPELRESFSTTGAMHVLAVSGLHVGIIYMVIGWLLGFLDKNKRTQRLKPIFIILFLWFYAFITGLSPSVMRATVMFTFMALAGVIGRKSQTFNTIFLSAFLLILYQPAFLFDVGFQLSYSAVIAIVYFQPKIVGLLVVKNRFLRWAWELTAVSLAAQIGTAPFSLFYFHQFPNYFLLSNFVVIPAASIILYLAITLFVVSWIPYLNIVVAFLLNWVLRIMYMAISGIEHLPHALSITWISPTELLLFYLTILTLVFLVNKITFRSLTILLTLILLIMSVRTVDKYERLTHEEVIVWNHTKEVMVNRIVSKNNLVLASDSIMADKLGHDYWEKCHATKIDLKADSNWVDKAFVCNQKTFLMLNQNPLKYKRTDTPLKVDYLIVSKHIYPSDYLFKMIKPEHVITCGNVSERTNKLYATLANKYNYTLYSIKEKGAWQINFSD
jgi:competence protein ComEC